MNCGQCEGIEKFFNSKKAQRRLKRYRKKGPLKTTRLLLDAIKRHDVRGMTLLDIGGGVGAVAHDLLSAGILKALDVDASSAYIEIARQEAERLGHADRISFEYGDFVELADKLEPADIVTLDRVICCYDDMRALVGLSSSLAKKLYGVVYPRDTWWSKLGAKIGNLILRISRNPFRTFIHPTHAVDSVIRANGFRPVFWRKDFLWQVVLYSRNGS